MADLEWIFLDESACRGPNLEGLVDLVLLSLLCGLDERGATTPASQRFEGCQYTQRALADCFLQPVVHMLAPAELWVVHRPMNLRQHT